MAVEGLESEASWGGSEGVEPLEKPEVEAPASAASDEKTEAPAVEPAGATSSATPPKMVPLPALLSERRQRQDLQQRLDDLERFVALQHQSAQPKAPEEEDWTEDKVIADLPGSLKKLEQKVLTKTQKARREERFEASEVTARAVHSDYDVIMSRYSDAARSVPGLVHAVENSPMPALTGYSAVRKWVADQEANNPDTREAEVQRRVQEEIAKLQANPAAKVFKSITSARGSGAAAPSAKGNSGPKTLDELFGGR